MITMAHYHRRENIRIVRFQDRRRDLGRELVTKVLKCFTHNFTTIVPHFVTHIVYTRRLSARAGKQLTTFILILVAKNVLPGTSSRPPTLSVHTHEKNAKPRGGQNRLWRPPGAEGSLCGAEDTPKKPTGLRGRPDSDV